MPQSLDLQVVKKAPVITRGPGLFAMVRNEDYFLPFFFDHYRALGVENFLIYDDRSDDRTCDFLFAQPDCTVMASDRSYGDGFGVDRYGVQRRLPAFLKETLPERAFPGRWALTVDADEFLILPSGFTDLNALIRHLDRIGQPYATAPLVDFYGETLDHRNYPPTTSPFEACPYFDAGPYYLWTDPPTFFPAGFRYRLLDMLLQKHPEQMELIYGERAHVAWTYKSPLLKHGCGVTRIGDHEISVTPAEVEVTAALAHFKFYPGLDAKISLALSERQYFNGSVEYAFLEAACRLMGRERLVSDQTRRFAGSQSLERAGLLPAVTT